jgi:hypothetical protein
MIVGYLIAELALGLPGADKKQIYMCYDSKYAYTELTIPRAAVTTAGTARKNYDMIRPAHTWIRRLVSRVRPLHINSHQKRPEQEGLATFLWDGNDRADKLCSGLLVK